MVVRSRESRGLLGNSWSLIRLGSNQSRYLTNIDQYHGLMWLEHVGTSPTIPGWWYTHPFENYARQLGLLFPIYGTINAMFQTTKQICLGFKLPFIVDLPMKNGDFPVRFLYVYHSFVGFFMGLDHHFGSIGGWCNAVGSSRCPTCIWSQAESWAGAAGRWSQAPEMALIWALNITKWGPRSIALDS